VEHRNGYTHSFLGAFLFTLPILLVNEYYYFVAVIGYLFHLIEYTLTPAGIKWLFPLKKKSFTLNSAKTGGAEEFIIFALSLIYIFKGVF